MDITKIKSFDALSEDEQKRALLLINKWKNIKSQEKWIVTGKPTLHFREFWSASLNMQILEERRVFFKKPICMLTSL